MPVKTEEMYLNMGPQHPSTHGVLRVGLMVDGEEIVSAEPDLGYLHRGMEKIAESSNYIKYVVMLDRTDYPSALTNEMAFILPVEKMLGLEVPERAQCIRTITMELNRIASHLLFFGTFGVDMGAITPINYAFRERELILDLLDELSGQRLLYHYFRIGGVYRDLPDGWTKRALDFVKWMRERLVEYDRLLSTNAIFIDRVKGVGTVTPAEALSWGFTGPSLRASGVKFDLRVAEPYCAYGQMDFKIPVGENGDCLDRYTVRMQEMYESTRIVEQGIKLLQPGEIRVKVPMRVKLPKGEWYARVAGARGEHGCYIVSDGGVNPYRLKIRSPSFSNLQLLQKMLAGCKIADVVAIIGSMDISLGDVDR